MYGTVTVYRPSRTVPLLYIGLHVQYLLFLPVFNGTSIFSKDFLKDTSNLMKIRPVGAEMFPADGQTDMTKLTAAFRNFANAPENKR
jgi:hypothetical protein